MWNDFSKWLQNTTVHYNVGPILTHIYTHTDIYVWSREDLPNLSWVQSTHPTNTCSWQMWLTPVFFLINICICELSQQWQTAEAAGHVLCWLCFIFSPSSFVSFITLNVFSRVMLCGIKLVVSKVLFVFTVFTVHLLLMIIIIYSHGKNY